MQPFVHFFFSLSLGFAGGRGGAHDTSVPLHRVALAHVPVRQRRPGVPEARQGGRRLDAQGRGRPHDRALQVSVSRNDRSIDFWFTVVHSG